MLVHCTTQTDKPEKLLVGQKRGRRRHSSRVLGHNFLANQPSIGGIQLFGLFLYIVRLVSFAKFLEPMYFYWLATQSNPPPPGAAPDHAVVLSMRFFIIKRRIVLFNTNN